MNTARLSASLSLVALSLGCAPVDDGTAAAGQAIHADTYTNAGGPQSERTALVYGCTATYITPRYAVTAAHCMVPVGAVVDPDVALSPSELRRVVRVVLPAGINPAAGDFTDSGERYADIALLELDADIDVDSKPATMEWAYPGADQLGYKVGFGDPFAPVDPLSFVDHQTVDRTRSGSDADGSFLTQNAQTDPGDDGGPFLRPYDMRLLGVLHDDVYDWGLRDKYTSVPRQLPFILSTIGYTGAFTTLASPRIPSSPVQTFNATTELACRYACDHTSTCASYTYVPVGWIYGYASCYLAPSTSGSAVAVPGAVSRRK